MTYSSLGSSFGGCGVPDNRHTVNNPTFGGNTSTMYASGSRQGGYYYSPIETRQENRYYYVDGKKVYY